MQVLLPNFVYRNCEQEQNTVKSKRKYLSLPRARTMEARRVSRSFSNIINIGEKSNELVKNESLLSTTTPKRLIHQRSLMTSPKQIGVLSLVHVIDDRPIHSHRPNRLLTTLQMRKNSQKKSGKKQKKIDTNFNFLTTNKCCISFHPTIQIEQVIQREKIVNKTIKSYSSRFPTKKVKTAFLVQQCRPWSPKKGQFNFDQIVS